MKIPSLWWNPIATHHIMRNIGGSAEPEKRRKKPTGASLAELAGGWSEKEAREFEESVRVFEATEEAMWK